MRLKSILNQPIPNPKFVIYAISQTQKQSKTENSLIFVYNLELTVTAQARKYDELGKH
jgi:hypothetical protein